MVAFSADGFRRCSFPETCNLTPEAYGLPYLLTGPERGEASCSLPLARDPSEDMVAHRLQVSGYRFRGKNSGGNHPPKTLPSMAAIVSQGNANAGPNEAYTEENGVDHATSGVTTSYRDLGEGEPLVLLHAFPLNGRMFESQMRAFSGSHRVVAPDYPGFGRSPRTPAQPDVHYYAEGVRGLLDRLHLERVILGGVSMGGYVAFECMRLFPERVTTLVLANTRA